MSVPSTTIHSTVEEIRQRFDGDVARFSNLETGQAAAIDSPLCTRLIAQAAVATRPDATSVLDVGCGAGNYTLVYLQELTRIAWARRNPSQQRERRPTHKIV